MIVVIGTVALDRSGPRPRPVGMAAGIALAAADAGARVECIAKVGDDPAGDELLLGLAQGRVSHVAVLRDAAHATPVRDVAPAADPGRDDAAPAIDAMLEADPAVDGADAPAPAEMPAGPTLEPADVQLALRYITEFRVIVAVRPSVDIAAECAAAASWGGAHLVVLAAPSLRDAGPWPADALVVEIDDGDDGMDGLAGRLGSYAAAVDTGTTPADAYRVLTDVSA